MRWQQCFTNHWGGTVSDSLTGFPLEGVRVTVSGLISGSSDTNFEGRYKITGLQPGTYTVEVSHSDYKNQVITLQMPPWTGAADFKMVPSSVGVKSIDKKINAKPGLFYLEQNYPNPFNMSTTIEFFLAKEDFVILQVYSPAGKEVATLCNGYRTAGIHSINFKMDDFPSGIYLYRMQVGEKVEMRKMVLVK